MIAAPACYGKLPALGDYVQRNAPHREVGVWWNRFTRMQERFGTRASGPRLPWCFTLPPGTFSWSGNRHLIGVITLSEDRIGRRYPFVAWQKASVKALQYPCLFAPEAGPRNWLFWLSRLVAAHTSFRPESPHPPTMQDFEYCLERLWALHRPAWRARLGLNPAVPAAELSQQLIGPLAPLNAEGVRFMPWADWPQRLWDDKALCYFWQQDHQGRYLRVFREKNLDIGILGFLLEEGAGTLSHSPA